MAAPSRRGPFWGIGCLVIGVGIFSLQDLILKLLSGDYPVHQAMTIRSLVAMPLLLALVGAERGVGRILTPPSPVLAVRGLINLVSYTTYYLGLAALPIATCVALYFTAPLAITVLSTMALGERAGPSRWAAVLLGFVGVVILVRPGSELFDWAALLPVIAGVSYASSQILARKVGRTEGAATMAAVSNAVFLVGALAMAAVFGSGDFADERHASLAFLLRGWATPSAGDLLLMMACGVIAAAALTLLSEAYRSTPASRVAPFEYSALGWSVIYGWAMWRELPDLVGWIGMSIIVGAGLFVLLRERAGSDPAQ